MGMRRGQHKSEDFLGDWSRWEREIDGWDLRRRRRKRKLFGRRAIPLLLSRQFDGGLM